MRPFGESFRRLFAGAGEDVSPTGGLRVARLHVARAQQTTARLDHRFGGAAHRSARDGVSPSEQVDIVAVGADGSPLGRYSVPILPRAPFGEPS